MQGFYYLTMLIGIAWLCAWVAFPGIVRRHPSPFDMHDAPPQPGDEAASLAQPAAGRRGAAPAADLQHPLPQRGAAKSWRVRREQAQASRREW
jgi:hypothetical protein